MAVAASLTLVVTADQGAAIIGPRGASVKAIKASSGVHSIHLSSNVPGQKADRTAVITGPPEAVLAAFDQVDATARKEIGLGPDDADDLRILVLDGSSLVGPAAVEQLRKRSGAQASVGAGPDAPGAKKQRVVTCTGNAAQVRRAVEHTLQQLAARHMARHKDFYAQWSFETAYNDHFETPGAAYADVAPVLRQVALERHGAPAARALARLTVYDPYYCQGAMREALAAATGCERERVLNENVDFYAAAAARALPAHDVLVTNPPYSGEHKQRLLQHLLSLETRAPPPQPPPQPGGGGGGGAAAAAAAAPFLLLMPAWLAASDYWKGFLKELAAVRAKRAGRGARRRRGRERRAGVFYICPTRRYAFSHPEGTGHATSPFHAVWFCGGWPTEGARRRAQRALREARRAGRVEVFRRVKMLRKRGALAE